MGSSINGTCECGYVTEELYVGSGRMNYETVCMFPHYCQNCQTLSNENIYDENLICSKCKSSNIIPYDDKRACSFMEHKVLSFDTKDKIGRDVKLSAINNLCPKCKNYKLRFLTGAVMWD